MPIFPFGNDPAKIERYKAFWNRAGVKRPLVGFSFVGWFPLSEFEACKSWASADCLTPEMVDPEAFLPDHLRMLREGEAIDDDLIRGACPAQVAIAWLPGMLGCEVAHPAAEHSGRGAAFVLGRSAGGPPGPRPSLVPEVHGVRRRRWCARPDGSFPVSHSPESGPTDLHAGLRGHTESVLDLADEPAKSAELLWRLGEIFRDATEEIWKRLPLFHGGYFDAQYSLWAPGPIIRMQEDATAVYSPALYRRFVQPVDRMLAAQLRQQLHPSALDLDVPAGRPSRSRRDPVLRGQQRRRGPPVKDMVPVLPADSSGREAAADPRLVHPRRIAPADGLPDAARPVPQHHGQRHERGRVATAARRPVTYFEDFVALSPEIGIRDRGGRGRRRR